MRAVKLPFRSANNVAMKEFNVNNVSLALRVFSCDFSGQITSSFIISVFQTFLSTFKELFDQKG